MMTWATSSGMWSQTVLASYSDWSRKVAPTLAAESISYFSRKEKLWHATKSALVQR